MIALDETLLLDCGKSSDHVSLRGFCFKVRKRATFVERALIVYCTAATLVGGRKKEQ